MKKCTYISPERRARVYGYGRVAPKCGATATHMVLIDSRLLGKRLEIMVVCAPHGRAMIGRHRHPISQEFYPNIRMERL